MSTVVTSSKSLIEVRNANIPQTLKDLGQWARWKKGSRDKMPTNLDNSAMSWGTPSNWLAFSQVAPFTQIGFILTHENGMIVLDCDGCRNPETGTIHPYVLRLIHEAHTYAEISPSGTGVKIYLLGALPTGLKEIATTDVPWRISPDQKHVGIEVYGQQRFLTTTGDIIPGCPLEVNEAPTVLNEVLTHFAPPPKIRKPRQSDTPASGNWDFDAWVRHHCDIVESLDDGYIIECPWVHEHSTPGDTARIWEGPPHTFSCFHAHCKGRTWQDVRTRYEPDAYTRIENRSKHNGQGVAEERLQEFNPRPHNTGAESNGSGSSNGSGAAAPPAVDPHRLGYTDLGNAERFYDGHKDKVRWCEVWNKWVVFNEKCWEVDRSGRVDQMGKATVRAIYAEAAAEVDDEKRKRIGKHAAASESNRAVRAMLDRAKSELPITPEEFNTHLHLINFNNCTLDLRTGLPQPHNSQDFLTRCIKIDYKPLALCNEWEKFLSIIFAGDRELINFVHQALGMSLSGDISEQCLFICHGNGSNGKTTMLEAVRIIMGGYGLAANIETFQVRKNEGIKNDVADLYGARLVTASENMLGSRLNEAFIKKVTGKEPLRGRRLHENDFEFMPELTLWLAVNHKPVVKDTTKGMWRRVHFIPFNVTFEEQQIDKHFLDKLLAKESEGILAWLVRGCVAWYAAGRLNVPQAVKEATQAYRAEMDTVADFLASECTFGDKLKASSKELLTRYESWCKQNGEAYEAKDLKRALNERGLHSTRSTGGLWVYRGVELRPIEKTLFGSDDSDGSDGSDTKNTVDSRSTETSQKTSNFESLPSLSSPAEHKSGQNSDGTVTSDGSANTISDPEVEKSKRRGRLMSANPQQLGESWPAYDARIAALLKDV